MGHAIFSEAALMRQRQRGQRDAEAGNAFGHHNEDRAFAPGKERRAASQAYREGWERGRAGFV